MLGPQGRLTCLHHSGPQSLPQHPSPCCGSGLLPVLYTVLPFFSPLRALLDPPFCSAEPLSPGGRPPRLPLTGDKALQAPSPHRVPTCCLGDEVH